MVRVSIRWLLSLNTDLVGRWFNGAARGPAAAADTDLDELT